MKVLVGTPAHDFSTSVYYNDAMNRTILLCAMNGVEVTVLYLSGDSLIQRARNDLVRTALMGEFDALVFIDGDQAWEPEWFLNLVTSPHDVVGLPVVKKSDQPAYNVKIMKDGIAIREDGFAEVECIGTGFLKISKHALESVANISEPYVNEGKRCRMVFDVKIIDGELVSEDNIFCHKWKSLGGQVLINPFVCCSHIGMKKWDGNFIGFAQAVGVVKQPVVEVADELVTD